MAILTIRDALNQALRENRPHDFVSTRHQELGMQPLQFGPGTSLWEWDATREQVLNAFGYVAGGYLTVFADELLGSAIALVAGGFLLTLATTVLLLAGAAAAPVSSSTER